MFVCVVQACVCMRVCMCVINYWDSHMFSVSVECFHFFMDFFVLFCSIISVEGAFEDYIYCNVLAWKVIILSRHPDACAHTVNDCYHFHSKLTELRVKLKQTLTFSARSLTELTFQCPGAFLCILSPYSRDGCLGSWNVPVVVLKCWSRVISSGLARGGGRGSRSIAWQRRKKYKLKFLCPYTMHPDNRSVKKFTSASSLLIIIIIKDSSFLQVMLSVNGYQLTY